MEEKELKYKIVSDGDGVIAMFVDEEDATDFMALAEFSYPHAKITLEEVK